jgi:hypothetical protein
MRSPMRPADLLLAPTVRRPRGLRRLAAVVGPLAAQLAVLFLVVLVCERIYRHAWSWVGSFLWNQPMAALMNVVLLGLIALALRLVVPSRWSLAVATVLAIGFTVSNRAKLELLGKPIYGTDFTLYQQFYDAFRIVGVHIALPATLLLVGFLGGMGYLSWRRMTRGRLVRAWLSALAACLALAIVAGAGLPAAHETLGELLERVSVRNIVWDQRENYWVNGQLMALAFNLDRSFDPPKLKYTESELTRAFAPADGATAPAARPLLPDKIVLITGEAYWDPTPVFGPFRRDPLALVRPYMTSLRAVVPVFGGYTSNSEFELLTGLSMRNLPVGSVPFQLYISRPLPSLPHALSAQGFATTVLQPYDKWVWNVATVYPLLGFQRFIDGEAFGKEDTKGYFVSDAALTTHVVEAVAAPGKQLVYAVTMETHGPYDEPERCTGAEGDGLEPGAPGVGAAAKLQVQRYACGIHDASKLFAAVVEHFRETGERAVVLMYGDHLPFLGAEKAAYVEAGLIKEDDSEKWTRPQWLTLFTTPVLFWASDGRKLPVEGPTGLSFLHAALASTLGLPLSSFQRYLLALGEKVHALNPDFAIDATGKILLEDDVPASLRPALADFGLIQYDLMFGQRLGEARFTAAAAPPAAAP